MLLYLKTLNKNHYSEFKSQSLIILKLSQDLIVHCHLRITQAPLFKNQQINLTHFIGKLFSYRINLDFMP